MFHGGCSTGRGWRDPAGTRLAGRERWWAELALGRSTADGAAEAELHDRGASPAVAGELFERSDAPAVAVVTVEAEGVLAGEQVGDGVQVDGVHGRSVARGGLRR